MPGEQEQQRRVDERWLADYVHAGLEELRRYLQKHARFERWLRSHNR